MLIAAFSDVHGNLPALEAILEDIERQDPDLVICGGDLVGYGAFPNQTVDLIAGRFIPTVMGNYDDAVGNGRTSCGCGHPDDRSRAVGEASLAWTKDCLTGFNRDFLRELPKELRFGRAGKSLVLVHGSPARLNEYVIEDVPEPYAVKLLQLASSDILAFGHTHLAYHRRVQGAHLVNLGSVGWPKDGDSRTGYALIELAEDIRVEFRRVAYDVEKAARGIIEVGLPAELADLIKNGRPWAD